MRQMMGVSKLTYLIYNMSRDNKERNILSIFVDFCNKYVKNDPL